MQPWSVMARSKAKLTGRLIIASAVILTVVTMALAAVGLGPRFTHVTGKDAVRIASADVRRGDIRFFTYRDDGGKEIRFILGRNESGQAQGAFDACQQCAQYRKGYTSSRGYLVCRFCGNRYRLDATAGLGSCAPIRLPLHEAGSAITVETSDLMKHRGLF